MNILIVKLSSLGDVVHTMPAVQDILARFPQAKIDWVVERAFAPLVTRCTGVNRVIPCELRRWRKSPLSAATRSAWHAFKQDLQTQAYDWVIDAQGLTKSALVARCAKLTPQGQRVAMANRTDGSGYEAPTRWVANRAYTMPAHCHAVTRSRILCAMVLNYEMPVALSFGLKPLVNQGSLAPENEAKRVAFVHGTSRADKEWPFEHWVALGQRLKAQGLGVDLLHGNDAEESRAHALAQRIDGAVVWPRLSLDALTDRMASCAGVIGVDSGLSHIAVALDLPHVQIYNFDTAWRTGPLTQALQDAHARQQTVFAQPTPDVNAVWQAWNEVAL